VPEELNHFAQHIKILPWSLKMRKGSKFSEIFFQNTSIFARRPKKGEKESKILKNFLFREHIKFLPGSLKKRKSGRIFQNFLVEHILSC